ncbi:MAG: N,N-dimethylformamidase, partial [Geminicoccaceae bacterium]|nr:N,N-dimethylformamidase [Geminicoccaceae bacterium]
MARNCSLTPARPRAQASNGRTVRTVDPSEPAEGRNGCKASKVRELGTHAEDPGLLRSALGRGGRDRALHGQLHRGDQLSGHPAREQTIDAGSYLSVPDHERLRALQGFTVMALIWPTTPARGRQGLIAKRAAASGAGFALEISDGELALTLGDGRGGQAIVRSGKRLLRRRWYLAAASFDPKAGLVTLVQRPLAPAAQTDDEAMVSETVAVVPIMAEGPLLMAGLPQADGQVEDHYNGKLDSPALFERALDPAELDAALLRPLPAWLRRHLVGAWDFAHAIPTTRVADRGPFGLDGELVNLPARAMKGWNWSGETLRWTERPEHYGAIHFHEDDLYDAGWQADFALTVLDDLKSGAYAAHVWCGESDDGTLEDYITFFVRPPR